jgi:hypothetical protein
MTSVRELIECAAQLLGSETKLANACEVTQNVHLASQSRGGGRQLLTDIIQRWKYQTGSCDDADQRFAETTATAFPTAQGTGL